MQDDTLDFLAELEKELDAQGNFSNDAIVPPGERECPICKQKMAIEQEGLATVDVCADHGIWLDQGELRSIIGSIRLGERVDRHAAMRRARREGKISAIQLGAWSLLVD